MMVVAVLMTSCQVSLNPKTGPSTAHSTMTATALTKVTGLPAARAVAVAKLANLDLDAIVLMRADSLGEWEVRGRSWPPGLEI